MKIPKRILVCRPDRIGDVILSTPLIRELKKSYPKIILGVLVNPYTKDVLLNNPNIDIFIEDNPLDHNRFGFLNQIKIIKKYKFDTALMLLPTERLAWMLFFAGIPRRIGVGTKLYQILTFAGSVSRNKYIPLRHEADYCMDLGRKIGVLPESLDSEIFITIQERETVFKKIIKPAIENFNSDNKKLICIHPGSNHSSPNWSLEYYYELTQKLVEIEHYFVFITGSKAEVEQNSLFNKTGMKRMINLSGMLNLRELCAVISNMNILVSSSTGPMHIAAGLKIPTLSLFCPLTACSPNLWGPKGNNSVIILPENGFCQTKCKSDPHTCILDGGIQVKNVFEKIKTFLVN